MDRERNYLPIFIAVTTLCAAILLAGCSKVRDDLPPKAPTISETIHPEGWLEERSASFHGAQLKARTWDASGCKNCHGQDLSGGVAKVSCFTCHALYPHSPGWFPEVEGKTFHGDYVENNGPTSCKPCHGNDYSGGFSEVSCTNNCHGDAGGHPSGWATPTSQNFHGLALLNSNWDLGACKVCHGNDYRGGNSEQSCYECHTGGPEDCTVCHGQPPRDENTLPIESLLGVNAAGAHNSHVNTLALDCSECHGAKPTDIQHADRLPAEITFALATRATLKNSSPTFSHIGDLRNGNGSCSGVYCHSSGTDQPTYVTVEWTKPQSGACGTCHDTDTNDISPATVIATGAHVTHLTAAHGPKLNCNACHNLAATAHTNGEVDFVDGATSVSSTGACLVCHGSGINDARQYWSSPSGAWLAAGNYCESCHDGSSTIAGETAPNVTAYYTSAGHGNSGLYPATQHGANGPGAACTVCHNATAAHIHANGNPRLKIDNTASGLCLDCHAVDSPAGTLGTVAVSRASIHGGSITGNYTSVSQYNYQCADCHSPHGTRNLAMVNQQIDGKLGYGFVTVNLTGALTALDPTQQPDDGTCDVCHDASRKAHAETSPPSEGPFGNHYQSTHCMACHTHTQSFKVRTSATVK